MPIESFSPLPLNVFGSWITLLDPSDVPPGMSPNLADVDFFPGGVRTRPGLVSQFPAIGGSPQINGLKTYITTNRVLRMLALDSNGNLYKETSPGTLALITPGGVTPSLYLASTTLFGREYMGFGDGITGQDMPRQFDDTYFDRVSQIAQPRALRWPIRPGGEYFAGRASVRGGACHAAGLLDGALAADFVDCGGRPPGCGDEYTHRPIERGAAPADLHRRRRREFLSRARDDGD
jgi:hypothetical protein